MINKAYYYSLFLCILLSSIFIFSLFLTYPFDRYHYLSAQKKFSSQFSYQEKEKIKKDIWHGPNYQDVHIEAKISNVMLRHNKGKIEVVEDLDQLHCFIREKNIQNTTKTSFFTSKRGFWTFPSNQLLTNDVDLYVFNSCDLDFSFPPPISLASLHGYAKTCLVQLKHKRPTFFAEDFFVTFKDYE